MSKVKKLKDPVSALVNLSIGAGILGVLNKMFGMNMNEEPTKKELVNGITNLVFDNYEKELEQLRDKNFKLTEERDCLERKNLVLETNLKKLESNKKTKSKKGKTQK